MPEILGRLRPPRLVAAPATPAQGEMYFDTATSKLYWWSGTAWVDASGGASDMGYYNVKTYGALGAGNPSQDDRPFIQAAIDAAYAAGGGIVVFPRGVYYIGAPLIQKSGVYLWGGGGGPAYQPSGPTGPARIRATSTFTGYILDTPASPEQQAFGASGIQLEGNGTTTANGGIRIRNAKWIYYKDMNLNSFSDEAIRQDAGNSLTCEDILVFNALLNRTRAAIIGVVDITGFDPLLTRCEISASSTSLTSVNQYIAAFAIRSTNGFFTDCVGEISEQGWYIPGDRNRFTGCRGDLNYGTGFTTTGGSNQFANCLALNNGRQTANTYDGFTTTGQRNEFSNCRADNTAGSVRYGFNDTLLNALPQNRSMYENCASTGYGTAPFFVDTYLGSGILNPPMPIRPANGTAVIDVNHAALVVVDYTTPTTITNFSVGYTCQSIRVLNTGTAAITIANNATIKTSTGADKVLATNKILEFTLYLGIWFENDVGSGGGGAPSGSAGGDLGGTYPNPTVTKAQAGFTIGGLAVLPPVVTTLPGSPVDGQEVYYQTAAMLTAGCMWHMRYDSSFSGSAKWELIGGSPWYAEVTTNETTSTTTYTTLTTAGPSITLPNQGTYDITVSCYLLTAAVAQNGAYMSVDMGSTGALDDWGVFVTTPSAVAVGGSGQRMVRLALGAAQLALVSKYRSSATGAGTVGFRQRRLSVLAHRLV